MTKTEDDKTYYDARHNLFYMQNVINNLQDEVQGTLTRYDDRLTPETMIAFEEVIDLLEQALSHLGDAVDSHDTPTKYMFDDEVTPL